MNRPPLEEDLRATLALTLALWGLAVAAATAAGVFTRVPLGVVVALSAFLSVAATLAVLVDRGLRSFLRDSPAAVLPATAAAFGAFAGADLALTPWDARLAQFPHALALLFALPLASAAATAALALRERAPRATSPGRKSPARTRGAT